MNLTALGMKLPRWCARATDAPAGYGGAMHQHVRLPRQSALCGTLWAVRAARRDVAPATTGLFHVERPKA